MLALAQRFGNERVGENKLGFHHVVDRQQDFGICVRRRIVAANARALAFGADEFAAESPPAVDRRLHLHLRDVAGIAVEIRTPHQRPVDAGRGNLQPIGGFDRVGDIEHRRQRARGGLAVLDRHGAVRPFGHDLYGAAGKAGDAHPHQPIAERRRAPARRRGDARRPPRLGDEPRLVGESRLKLVGLSSMLCRGHVLKLRLRTCPAKEPPGLR